MLRPIPIMLFVALAVAGCSRISGSSLNPFNWFGPSTVVATAPDAQTATQTLLPADAGTVLFDDRVLIPDVTDLVIEQTADGAIIRATGIAPTQGYYNAQLVRSSVDNGVLTYEFRVDDPEGGVSVGSVASRTISTATTLTGAALDGIRTIRVIGDTTTRVVTR